MNRLVQRLCEQVCDDTDKWSRYYNLPFMYHFTQYMVAEVLDTLNQNKTSDNSKIIEKCKKDIKEK